MHVRHLVRSNAFAGVERYLADVAPALAARGIEVSVVGGDPLLLGGVLTGQGIEWQPAVTTAAVVRGARHGGGADLFHTHMTAADLAGVLAGAWPYLPLVSSRHFLGPRGSSVPARFVGRCIERRLAADLAISDAVRRSVPASRRSRVVTVRNGVPDPGAPSPAMRQPVVLVAQRLEAEKSTEVAIDAWARSGLAERGWHLDIAGDGAEGERLRARAAELAPAGSVRWLGQVSDVRERLAEVAVLLAPSSADAFGLTVVEAMAAGTPVVAAAAGGHLETVGAATPGTVFAPGDVEAAAAVLVRLVDDPVARGDAGRDVRAAYLADLTLERHVDDLLRHYRRVLATTEAVG